MITTNDILQFWTRATDLQVHPDDSVALNTHTHNFELRCLVGPWWGPIRTAPIVLLFLNPKLGNNGAEINEAQTPAMREKIIANLRGDAPLPDFENWTGRKWAESHLKQFGLSYRAAASKVAFVNLMPYRSTEGTKDRHMIKHLTSARLILAWARDTLFREADLGERVVVCLRSNQDWGRTRKANRGGYTFLDKREEIGKAVRRAVFGIPT
jgi:hypothetical protein